MSESPLSKKIQLIASQLGHRLFRVNTGMGWAGKAIHFSKPCKITVMPGDVLIKNAYPLHTGLIEGGSDNIGWSKDGKFMGIEIKIKGHRTEPDRLRKQTNFIEQIKNAGGIAGFVEEEQDFLDLLK